MHFKSQEHQQIFMTQVKRNPNPCPNENLAALYLITADTRLWYAARGKITYTRIPIRDVDLLGVGATGYTFAKIVEDILKGTSNVTVKDLCDKYVISEKNLKLVTGAIHICRGGYQVLPFVNQTYD